MEPVHVFNVGDPVTVVALNLPGRVVGYTVTAENITYHVIWWVNSSRQDGWLYEWEIERRGPTRSDVEYLRERAVELK